MRVLLRSIAGHLAEVHAEPGGTVAELEAAAGPLLGLAPARVRLALGGEVLDGAQVLETLCLEDSSGLVPLLAVAAAEPEEPPAAEAAEGAFDFDALDAETAGAEALLVRLDARGRPRGQCCACDCVEWLPPDDEPAAAAAPVPARAYNAVLTEAAAPGSAVAATTAAGTEAAGAAAAGAGGEVCRRCGCAAGWHADVSRRLARLEAAGALVEADKSWSDLERSVFLHTEGLVHPRRCGTPAQGPRGRGPEDAKPMVSVICPTSTTRRAFHRSLYRCFCEQEYDSKELVVVDTGEEGPSAYFAAGPPAADPRVRYRHYPAPAGRPWSLGAKRNVACLLAAGDAIVHFDDDDLYAPGYLSWMVGTLECGAGAEKLVGGTSEAVGDGARDGNAAAYAERAVEAVALTAWYTLRLANGSFGSVDASRESVKDGRLSRRFRGLWAFGYGFGLAYWRSTWQTRWFRDLPMAEDADFLEAVLARGGRAALLGDCQGLCLRGIHDACACAWWASAGPERPPPAGEDVDGPAPGGALFELATLLLAEWSLRR